MRILYISHLHPPENAPLENMGGMQRVSMQLLDEFKSNPNVTVKEITQKTPWKGIELYTAKFLGKLYFKLPSIIHHFKPDVILFSSMVTASLARMLRKKVQVPMVTINHGQDVTLPIKAYQRFVPGVFNALDGVISVSRATKEACIERGMDSKKGQVLPNGFDSTSFPEMPDKAKAKKELEKHLGIDLKGRKVLLTVGRKVKRKGHAWFIKKVLPKIKNDVLYITVGEGPEFEKLQNIVVEENLQGEVILSGKQSDEALKMIYSAADLFVMPNIKVLGDMEGFGVVMLEANSAGCPVVASALEGILDVVKDGQNGYLVAVNDHQNFAQRVDEILNDGWEAFSWRSREYVIDRFSWKKVAESYIEHLHKFIK